MVGLLRGPIRWLFSRARKKSATPKDNRALAECASIETTFSKCSTASKKPHEKPPRFHESSHVCRRSWPNNMIVNTNNRPKDAPLNHSTKSCPTELQVGHCLSNQRIRAIRRSARV
jgi:hypothetical protein